MVIIHALSNSEERMVMLYIIIPYSIAVLAIVLGFVALLTQKIYIDHGSKSRIEVDIPFFGKMKTNFPTLIFVFLGVGMTFFTFKTSFPPNNILWNIQGTIKSARQDFNWRDGTLTLIPSDIVTAEIGKKGDFRIRVNIEEGKIFEEKYAVLDYSHIDGNMQIELKQEYDAWINKQDSRIEHATSITRKYKPIDLSPIPNSK